MNQVFPASIINDKVPHIMRNTLPTKWSFLRIRSHLLKKFLNWKLHFCVVHHFVILFYSLSKSIIHKEHLSKRTTPEPLKQWLFKIKKFEKNQMRSENFDLFYLLYLFHLFYFILFSLRLTHDERFFVGFILYKK